MPYGTVKVDNVTFTNNSVDATTTFSGIYASITDNLTLSGTATATTFTGTTANFTNVNAQNIGVTTSLSGLAITGGTAGFTTITGTTVTGTTANFVTVSGTTVTGNTGQFTNLAGAAAGFTTVTGTTVTGTTANFVSGVFTTRISGTTVTGTTASFTSGVFASLSGTTHTITSGVFALGTAALPSISFVSDPNTGIFSPGANQVAISTNGTGRLFVDATGNVGLGTSTPAALLHLTYFGQSNLSDFPGNTIRLEDTDTSVQAEQPIGKIEFFANDGTTPNVGVMAYILSKSAGTIGGGDLRFGTTTTGGVNNERLRITSAGLVGIGTSSPGALLDISASAPEARISSSNASQTDGSSVGKLTFHTSDPTTPGGAGVVSTIETLSTTSNGSDYRLLISKREGSGGGSCSIDLGGSSNGSIALSTNTSGSATTRMFISSAGLVGIGTTSPAAALDVVGDSIKLRNASSGTNFGYEVNINHANGVSQKMLNARFMIDGQSGAHIEIAGINAEIESADSNVYGMSFRTGGSLTEKVRIDGSGRLLVGTSTSLGTYLTQINFAGASTNGVYINSSSTSGDGSAMLGLVRASTPNNTVPAISYADATAGRFELRNNGGFANYQANDVNLSDRNAKKDITLAAGTWNCIKEWEIVNYRYKDQSDDSDLNLGVIAQQVAESCPEVITIFQEAKDATEDKPAQEERLGVKEQQMYWMAIKALQEAMERIEQLETSNADLLARVIALETT